MAEKVLYPKLLAFSLIMLTWIVLAWPAGAVIADYCQKETQRKHPDWSQEEVADVIDWHVKVYGFLAVFPVLTIPVGVGGLLYRWRLIRKAAFVNACRGSRSSA